MCGGLIDLLVRGICGRVWGDVLESFLSNLETILPVTAYCKYGRIYSKYGNIRLLGRDGYECPVLCISIVLINFSEFLMLSG